ncbi:ABC protein [Suillus paluster]|uniref:ABC protein n=1 Tax=Suillus paluster TaxID=48578 RepID=UPI001B878090|nr:ABC protein [Suillus paluster]KAG1747098.1 ABC protein [Suillus paluster]
MSIQTFVKNGGSCGYPKTHQFQLPLLWRIQQLTPLANASIFSQLTYTLDNRYNGQLLNIDPNILCSHTYVQVLGYQRTLQASDLYKLGAPREVSRPCQLNWKLHGSDVLRQQLTGTARLESGELRPSFVKRTGWALRAIFRQGQNQGATWSERRVAFQKHWRESEGRKEASLTWALNDVFGSMFWIGGIFGDIAQLMSPIVLRQIIVFAEERSAAIIAGEPVPNVGRGVAMAFGLFALAVIASICTHQFFWRSMTAGVLARAALIACIYERGVNLTSKARVKLNNAALINHISTDVSRVDACAQWFLDPLTTSMQISRWLTIPGWTVPIQVTICLIILLSELGPSALAGFSLFVLIIPIQERLMTLQHRIRLGSMKWTDQRAKVLLEVLGAMRVVKYFSYEVPFLQRIFELRRKELRGIRQILHSSSANVALATTLPALAATLAFVTYTLTAHNFNVAVIFTSLNLFQLLRQPMMWMPRALSAIPDASSAIQRLTHLFRAELISEDALVIDEDQEPALLVKDATFEWDSFEKDSGEAFTSKMGTRSGGGPPRAKGNSANEDKATEKTAPGGDVPLFRVKNVTMTIQRGHLVAVVGRVGSGKSSLLQGLIGEMRKVSGHVSFGGRVGYCPQTAWIQNSTLRDNIIFGRPFEEDRYWRVLETACLLPDLQLLPDGDLTEIGEKGINLSGGQKQRVNIARALYFDPDIVIFDDPLSAVDAHVGKSLFQDAIVGALRNRGVTVILVTHAIHFLSQVDHIYTLNNGVITESGTYDELISHGGDFARLDLEFGGHASEGKDEDQAEEITPQTGVTIEDVKLKSKKAREKATGSGKIEGRLIVKEKRSTGSVSWGVYWTYLVAARGSITGPLVIFFMLAMQGSQVLNAYTLIWWESNKLDRPISFYQTLYGCLGVSQAIFAFLLCAGMDFMAFHVSQNLHHKSVRNVFYARMSFFDSTPMGRILGIFGKDIDNVDNQLAFAMRLLVLTLSNCIGSIIIIVFLEPYFIIAIFFILIGYSYFAAFHRASAREVKRLESMLRSLLYAHFSETLTGLPTIRSYGEMKRFIAANRYYVDLEDRALYLVVTNQRQVILYISRGGRWLNTFPQMACDKVRLHGRHVALLAVIDVSGINATQIGLVLTYTTMLSQMCRQVTREAADVENCMNSVERLVQYVEGDAIPQEAPHEIEERKPPARWPEYGAVEFNDVKMTYRPGLPNVLKGVSIKVRGGEKIGVVGRTGAGKSSLMLALFRIVELSGGSITIDGVDISTIGLKDLRSKISIIPQDVGKPLLFSGTMRSNLDPFSQHGDAELWNALHRSCLVDSSTTSKHSSSSDDLSSEQISTSGHNLDDTIESEGANLSVGERSLLSLARALVKDCKVVVLDEATASVDLETDNQIQQTIQTEFKNRTLLCIAHRLRTIISYDRILVLDAGLVAEFDTPSNLFKVEGGLFRGMCERSNISLKDIEMSRQV